jgi:hypothetical protein
MLATQFWRPFDNRSALCYKATDRPVGLGETNLNGVGLFRAVGLKVAPNLV